MRTSVRRLMLIVSALLIMCTALFASAKAVQTKPQGKQGHKNKYGHDYDPDPLNPQY